jgi:Arc/MetJ family transcription regulator
LDAQDSPIATQFDLGEDAVGEAMRLSGARSKKKTVNLALRA